MKSRRRPGIALLACLGALLLLGAISRGMTVAPPDVAATLADSDADAHHVVAFASTRALKAEDSSRLRRLPEPRSFGTVFPHRFERESLSISSCLVRGQGILATAPARHRAAAPRSRLTRNDSAEDASA